MSDRRLVPPPKPSPVAPPTQSAPHAAPGRTVCWVDYDRMWIKIEGGGTEATAAMPLDQAERHLENVRNCIAQLKGGDPKPTTDTGRAALAVEGDRR